MAVQIQLKRGTQAQWTSADPILALGEVGIETDSNMFKFGDGLTSWSALPYVATGSGGSGVTSVNGDTGPAVVLSADDIDDSGTANKFVDQADIDKLDGIEVGATADMTGSQIKAAYEAEVDTNAFTDADVAKLTSIEPGATTDQTADAVPIIDATDQFAGGSVEAALEEIITTVWKKWSGTQTAYDGLGTHDPDTLYIITGA